MKFVGFFTLAAMFLVMSLAQESKKPLLMRVYIESKCRFSRKFITEQFPPAYDLFKKEIKVEFFTHGKSTSTKDSNGTVTFECQHGPPECDSNKLQSCGLELIRRSDEEVKDRQAEFVVCTMGESEYPECYEKVSLDQQEVEDCASGDLGTQLQLDMEVESRDVIAESGHVPTITYSGIFDENRSAESLVDLQGCLSRLLAENW